MAPQTFDRFLSSLKSYYNTEALSDIIIICDGQEFKVHGIILAAHSEYFSKELNGNWKESHEKKIEIEDFDTSVVEAMLRFMYTFDYSNIHSTSCMIYDAQVYQIADRYDIPALKAHAKGKFSDAITTGWSMDDFPLAISMVYSTTPSGDRGLRDLAVETSRKNIDQLLQHDGFCELLRETADFAADLIPFLCDGVSETAVQRYRCPSCSHQFRAELSGKSYYYCLDCGSQYSSSNWNSYRVKG